MISSKRTSETIVQLNAGRCCYTDLKANEYVVSSFESHFSISTAHRTFLGETTGYARTTWQGTNG